MKRVLLVRPEESRTKYNFKGVIENECLDLEIIQTILETNGYEVTIFDLQVEPYSFEEWIQKNTYDVLYVEGRCFQETFMKEYVRTFRQYHSGITIIGGYHAQTNYKRFYMDELDYILTGFNYNDLPFIIEGKLDGIVNVCYRKDGEWKKSPSKAIDISSLPLPNRSYFYNHPKNYQYLDLPHAMWLRTAFSCPYQCSFCIRKELNLKTYSRRKVEDVLDEIEKNENEVVYLVDDDFLVDEQYIQEFLKGLKERGIKRRYICYGRSDFISTHESLMKEFSELGLYYVLVGLEDIREEKLKEYNKLNHVENNQRCIEICHRYGIHLMAMFILGLDYVGKDFHNLYRYIKENQLRHVAVSIYTPELGLDSFDGEWLTDDPSKFDYLHLVAKPKHLSIKKYYFHYYILLIRLFLKAQREGVYSFLDYGDYIRSFLRSIFHLKERSHD